MTGEWHEGAETDEELKMAFMETWFKPKSEMSEEERMLNAICRAMREAISDKGLRLIRAQASEILTNRESLRKDGNYYG